jgi:hypothetical protein
MIGENSMAKRDFISSVRTAVGFLDPEIQTDSQHLDSEEIRQHIRRAVIWLTPKSVEGFVPQDFAELPEAQRNELDAEVETFRSIAEDVPAGTPATEKQIEAALPHFLKIVSLVREAVLPPWIADLDMLLSQVESWCEEQGWSHKRQSKVIRERLLGPYEVEQLRFHTGQAGFMLDPVARFVPGGLGMVDLYILPTLDSVMIPRTEEGWVLHVEQAGNVQLLPWGQEQFNTALSELAKNP